MIHNTKHKNKITITRIIEQNSQKIQNLRKKNLQKKTIWRK